MKAIGVLGLCSYAFAAALVLSRAQGEGLGIRELELRLELRVQGLGFCPGFRSRDEALQMPRVWALGFRVYPGV